MPRRPGAAQKVFVGSMALRIVTRGPPDREVVTSTMASAACLLLVSSRGTDILIADKGVVVEHHVPADNFVVELTDKVRPICRTVVAQPAYETDIFVGNASRGEFLENNSGDFAPFVAARIVVKDDGALPGLKRSSEGAHQLGMLRHLRCRRHSTPASVRL